MKTALLLVSLLVTFLMGASRTHADRDIVYAARYYLRPGSPGTSHFHLYRISADGTGRTQLTFGEAEDYDPQWSPDGRRILFIRQGRGICLVGASGGPIQTLLAETDDTWGPYRWLPDRKTIAVGHTQYLKDHSVSAVYLIDSRTHRQQRRIAGAFDYRVSPNGRYAFLPGNTGDRIQDRRTGTFFPLKQALPSAFWLDEKTLIGTVQDSGTERTFLRTAGVDGQLGPQITPQFPRAFPGADTHDTPAEEFANLLSIPQTKDRIVYALNNHNSTVGTDYLFFTMPTGGTALSYLTEGQFLAWSPDGKTFCTAPGRDTTPYDKRRFPLANISGQAGSDRTVWTAPLFVRAASGGGMRQITPRLSWVTGADWRHSGRKSIRQ